MGLAVLPLALGTFAAANLAALRSGARGAEELLDTLPRGRRDAHGRAAAGRARAVPLAIALLAAAYLLFGAGDGLVIGAGRRRAGRPRWSSSPRGRCSCSRSAPSACCSAASRRSRRSRVLLVVVVVFAEVPLASWTPDTAWRWAVPLVNDMIVVPDTWVPCEPGSSRMCSDVERFDTAAMAWHLVALAGVAAFAAAAALAREPRVRVGLGGGRGVALVARRRWRRREPHRHARRRDPARARRRATREAGARRRPGPPLSSSCSARSCVPCHARRSRPHRRRARRRPLVGWLGGTAARSSRCRSRSSRSPASPSRCSTAARRGRAAPVTKAPGARRCSLLGAALAPFALVWLALLRLGGADADEAARADAAARDGDALALGSALAAGSRPRAVARRVPSAAAASFGPEFFPAGTEAAGWSGAAGWWAGAACAGLLLLAAFSRDGRLTDHGPAPMTKTILRRRPRPSLACAPAAERRADPLSRRARPRPAAGAKPCAPTSTTATRDHDGTEEVAVRDSALALRVARHAGRRPAARRARRASRSTTSPQTSLTQEAAAARPPTSTGPRGPARRRPPAATGGGTIASVGADSCSGRRATPCSTSVCRPPFVRCSMSVDLLRVAASERRPGARRRRRSTRRSRSGRRFGDWRITLPVAASAAQRAFERCPREDPGHTVACPFGWDGTVTLDRLTPEVPPRACDRARSRCTSAARPPVPRACAPARATKTLRVPGGGDAGVLTLPRRGTPRRLRVDRRRAVHVAAEPLPR